MILVGGRSADGTIEVRLTANSVDDFAAPERCVE